MVYFNMSHHYRRIYSAKPRIDTNLSKKSQSPYCCSSPDILDFVKRNCIKQPIITTPRYRVCTKEEEQQQQLFKPKILNYKAESKLRSLSVYQPPQKIVKIKSNETKAEKNKHDNVQPKTVEKENLCNDNNVPPEIKEEPPKIIDIKEKEPLVKQSEVSNDENYCEDPVKFRPLDKSTVMFLKDITDDILKKGIYTNKSLEKLFFHHIQKNKYNLPKELMEEEVTRLKKELEMPIEDEKSVSESALEDEEVLTALESLLLPADIRDQVADSLGLKRKLPPLPSPKDSFTGSLVLTSMSEGNKSYGKPEGTYTLKYDEFKDTKENNSQGTGDSNLIEVQQLLVDNKTAISDNDDTTVDEDYPEEINSEKTSNAQEVLSEHLSEDQGSKSEEKSNFLDIKSELQGNFPNIKEASSNEVESEEIEYEEEKSHGSEVKDSQNDDSGRSLEVSDKKNDDATASDKESIHTESEK